jgi:hypothetical protein
MHKVTRVVVLIVGMMSMLGAVAGVAGASSWTNSGFTSFTATTGPGSLTAGGQTLSCAGATATGTAPAREPGPDYTITGSISYPNCRLGFLTVSISCAYIFTGGAPVTAGVTAGTTDVVCRDEQRLGCRITGTVPTRYANATGRTGVNAGRFDINGSSGLNSAGCILSGAATLLPNPDVFLVTGGSGGSSGFRGPILSQP